MCITDVLESWHYQEGLLSSVTALLNRDLFSVVLAHKNQRRRGRTFDGLPARSGRAVVLAEREISADELMSTPSEAGTSSDR